MHEAGITTVEALADMTPEQLEELPGIGPKTVEKISIAVNNYFATLDAAAPVEGEPAAVEAGETPVETTDADAGVVEATDAVAEVTEGEPAVPAEATPAEAAPADDAAANEPAPATAEEIAQPETPADAGPKKES